jgi:hypothetical protein
LITHEAQNQILNNESDVKKIMSLNLTIIIISAEFFNIRNNQMISIDIGNQLKMNYHRTVKGQREPMTQNVF